MLKYIFLALVAFTVSVHGQIFDSHEISQAEAAKMIGAFQTGNTLGMWSVHAGTLPKDAMKWLLSRKGAASLSYFWGLDEKNDLQVIYVASNADGSEILDNDAILYPRRNTLHSEMSADNILTVKQAVAMMRRYRNSALFERYKKHLGASMSRSAIMRLTEPTITAGVRSYFAMNATGTPTLVFVGTTSAANDNPTLFEDRGRECPPDCPIISTLVKLSSLE